MKSVNLKKEIVRAFLLACSLEPLGEKPGCTTRYIDSSPGTKLKYFTIAAINSADAIGNLVDELLHSNIESVPIFKYGYLAQLESVRNRLGSKVNYGQILMLLPVIKAQCIIHKKGEDPNDIKLLLRTTTNASKNENIEDVNFFQKLVDVSISQSIEHNKRLGKKRKQLYPKFVGLYKSIYEASFAPDYSQTMMATELQEEYKECYRIYLDLNSNGNTDLIEQSEKIYPKYLDEMTRHDIAADCIVVAMYLTLIIKKDEKIFL